jgi:hypothetical protein
MQMGEPKSEALQQSNGEFKQKPRTLNLTSGTSFYRPSRKERLKLSDRFLQQQEQQHTVGTAELNGSIYSNNISRLKVAVDIIPTPINNESNRTQLSAQSTVLPVLAEHSVQSSVVSALSYQWSTLANEYEDQRESPPPPTPVTTSDHSQFNNNIQSHSINQLSTYSSNHGGFTLYTPPAPIPVSGTNNIRYAPNGLPQPLPRRLHSVDTPSYNLTALQSNTAVLPGHNKISVKSTQQQPKSFDNSSPSISLIGLINDFVSNNTGATNRLKSIVKETQQRENHQQLHKCVTEPVTTNLKILTLPEIQEQKQKNESIILTNSISTSNINTPRTQSLWNNHIKPPDQLPLSIVAITSSSITSSSSTSSVSSLASGIAANLSSIVGNHPTSIITCSSDEQVSTSTVDIVLDEFVTRQAYASTLPHKNSTTSSIQGPILNIIINPGNFNTWTSGTSLKSRPRSIVSTPQGSDTPLVTDASPSDSGYCTLPSTSSDYQLMSKSSSFQQTNIESQNQSAVRRLSLPSTQSLLRPTTPKPSPTFHGLPFKPFTCSVSPNGNPIFLGCTHLHTSTANINNTDSNPENIRIPTSITSPASILNTAQAIQQLLAQSKNSFKAIDDKLSLFIEILDTQDRFAKVSK